MTLDRDARSLPAATYSAVLIDGMPWYRVTFGSFVTRVAADSMISNTSEIETATALYAPFSVVLARGVTPESAEIRLQAFRERKRPVFALVQDDGSVTVFAGAFETPEQSAQLLSELRADGEQVSVAYRTGKVFQ